MGVRSAFAALDKAISERIAELERKCGAGLSTWDEYLKTTGRIAELKKEFREKVAEIKKRELGDDAEDSDD